MPNTKMHFDADVDNSDQTVSDTKTWLHGFHVYNNNSSASYLQLFDNTGPTVGTTTPNMSFGVAANSSITVDFAESQEFNNGLHYAGTTAAASAGDPTNGLSLSLRYRSI